MKATHISTQPDLTSPSQIFDFNNLEFAVPESDAFAMGNSAFGHPFDFGFMPMDLDQYTVPLDWVRLARLIRCCWTNP